MRPEILEKIPKFDDVDFFSCPIGEFSRVPISLRENENSPVDFMGNVGGVIYFGFIMDDKSNRRTLAFTYGDRPISDPDTWVASANLSSKQNDGIKESTCSVSFTKFLDFNPDDHDCSDISNFSNSSNYSPSERHFCNVKLSDDFHEKPGSSQVNAMDLIIGDIVDTNNRHELRSFINDNTRVLEVEGVKIKTLDNGTQSIVIDYIGFDSFTYKPNDVFDINVDNTNTNANTKSKTYSAHTKIRL